MSFRSFLQRLVLRRPFVAGAVLSAAVLVPAAALGQQPGRGEGRGPGMPPGHPPVQQPPPQIGPDGRPVPPGRRPPPRPGMPGMPGMPPPTAPKKPAATPAHDEHGAGAKHGGHCPGHGPTDPPGHVNLWQGLLWVDNDKAQQPGVNKLLYRYENKLDPCDPKNQPPPFLASLLNFGLFGFVLFRFGKKPLQEGLRRRKQQIMTDIDTASRLREQAEDRLVEYEEKIERLEETLAELRAEQRAQAHTERQAILAEAEERRVRLVKDAELRVEQELAAAKDQVVKDALLSALTAAEELIAKRATATDHERLGREYLGEISKALSSAEAVR